VLGHLDVPRLPLHVQEDVGEQREEECLPASSTRKNAPTAAATTA
jgi:hypothetical protein